MTKKGAEILIEELSLRVFELEEYEQRLKQEMLRLKNRLKELNNFYNSFEDKSVIINKIIEIK
jgi:uncharacterized coiled-coil protein SlyX